VLQADSSGFDSDEVIEFFNLPNPSSRTMALRSTQPLTEMSTRNLSGGKGRPARKADKLVHVEVFSKPTSEQSAVYAHSFEPILTTGLW
jgi:hypothetical protein